ncbi:MAG: hypothetical protein ABFC84_09780 [Veillonellales bacterium]
MGSAIRRLQKRNKARKSLAELMENSDHVLVIHYSCESFYDRETGTSPRITSIAVRNFANGQTKSFSVHQIAERQNLLNTIDQEYDTLEKKMLDEFYVFVHAHTGFKWLHWNMRDMNYGFEAIEHRYKVLGGTPTEIPEQNRIDLNRLLIDIYGVGYIGHPRLTKIIELNKISNKDFLTGSDESEAFINKEYVRLHFSTLRKVDILANIADRADQGSLLTNTTWKENINFIPQVIGEWFKENWLASLLLGIISIIGLVLGLIQLF